MSSAPRSLLEAGVSQSQLIRYRDGLVQKYGGWEKYYAFSLSGRPRDLHAWQDLKSTDRLLVGTTSLLGLIASDTLTDITPQQLGTDPSVNFTTTINSTTVEITDNDADLTASLTTTDYVFIEMPVAVGGLVLFGVYAINTIVGADTYRITAASAATSLLGQHFNVETHSIHAYVIGEYGDSQVPVWSLANIAGMRLDEFSRLNGISLDASSREQIAENTRTAVYEIIRRKEATYYAIAAGLVRIIEAIVRDENNVLTVSGIVNGIHGMDDVALSLPCVINRQGIANTFNLPLSEEEETGLKKSAQVLRASIQSLDLDHRIEIGSIPSARLLAPRKETV